MTSFPNGDDIINKAEPDEFGMDWKMPNGLHCFQRLSNPYSRF